MQQVYQKTRNHQLSPQSSFPCQTATWCCESCWCCGLGTYLLGLQHGGMRRSGSQVQEPLSISPMESSAAAMSSGLVLLCFICSHLIQLYFLPVRKAQTYPRPQINIGSDLFHNPVQGFFSLCLSKGRLGAIMAKSICGRLLVDIHIQDI